MGEVEAQPVGRDERALLRHMIAEDEPQRLVQDMGRGMVGAGRRAGGVIDGELDRQRRRARSPSTIETSCTMRSPSFLRVSTTAARKPGAGDFADVADLAAGLAVERRLVEDERAFLARLQPLDLHAVLDDGARSRPRRSRFRSRENRSRRSARARRTRPSRSQPRPIPPRRGAPRRAGAPSRR